MERKQRFTIVMWLAEGKWFPLPVIHCLFSIRLGSWSIWQSGQAGLFDVSHMGEVLFEGRMHLKNINYILTNDFKHV